MSGRFEGKVAVITGAAGGIGKATVERFVGEGANVLAVDLDEGALRTTLGHLGNSVALHAADVSQEDATVAYFAAAAERFGGIDCVFAGAGIIGDIAPIEDYSMETYDRLMAVNVRGVFLSLKHAIPHLLRRGGGAIVNAASVAGLQASPLIPAYNASKHAVVGLTRNVAAVHTQNNIRVNAICPGPIDTAMVAILENVQAGGDVEAGREITRRRVPAGRHGRPEEVAALIAFLCSDEARFINGSLYTIDGGTSQF